MALLKRNHKDLLVWRESVKLAVLVYRATEAFPRSELYGLTSQIRRAATSVPANIAEGAGRTGTPELLRFLSIASGSLSELDSHFEVAYQLGYIKDRETIEEKSGRVFRLLTGLTASLKRKAQD